MKTLCILALVSLAIFVVDAKKDRHQRVKSWEHWNHVNKADPKQLKDNKNCKMLPERLLDWFHILRTMHIKEELKRNGLPKPEEVLPRMKLEAAKRPFPSGFEQTACREPINSVFRFVLDQNSDGVLDKSELADIYEISTEPCIKQFFEKCAKGRETFTEVEFCGCFTNIEPPCFRKLRSNLPYLLVRGKAQPIPGVYTPSCDEDGFYLPSQCRVNNDRQGDKKCWCVDRNGSKIEGLTKCVDNTEPPKDEEEEEE